MLCMYIMLKNVSFVYRTLNLHYIVTFFLHVVRCTALFDIFSIVRTSWYRKTDCIRVNCDAYGNISGIVEGFSSFFQEFRTYRDTFHHVFLRIFFVTSLYIHLYNMYVYTFIHTYVRLHIYYKRTEKKCIINYFYLKNSFAITSYIFSIHFVMRNC